MESESLTILTTPGIGTGLFPGVLAGVLARHPEAAVALSERGWPHRDGGEQVEGFAMAVLPTLALPHPAGLREHVLWREPFRVLVRADHELVRACEPVGLSRLAGYPLVISGSAVDRDREIPALLAARGFSSRVRADVEDPHTLVGIVRRGLAVGVEKATALDSAVDADLVVLEIDDPDMVSEVAAYWYDSLLTTALGRALYQLVLDAPVPRGATAVGRRPALHLVPAGDSSGREVLTRYR